MSKEKTLVAAVCPKCGANLELDSSLEVAYCMYCRAKVIINSSTKNVKLDKSKDLENLYTLARRARENDNAEDALKYYEKILVEDPNNWEPTFYNVYYRALNCKVGEIPTVLSNINNCLETIFDLIKETCEKKEIDEAVDEVTNHTILICSALYESAVKQLSSLSLGVSLMLIDTQKRSVVECINTLYHLGDLLESNFKKEIAEKAKLPWILAINLSRKSAHLLAIDKKKDEIEKTIQKYGDKIKKYAPEYEVPVDPTQEHPVLSKVLAIIFIISIIVIIVSGIVIMSL